MLVKPELEEQEEEEVVDAGTPGALGSVKRELEPDSDDEYLFVGTSRFRKAQNEKKANKHEPSRGDREPERWAIERPSRQEPKRDAAGSSSKEAQAGSSRTSAAQQPGEVPEQLARVWKEGENRCEGLGSRAS